MSIKTDPFAKVLADIKNLSVVEVDPKSITKRGLDLSHKGVGLNRQAFLDLCNTFSFQYTVLGPEQRSPDWDDHHPNGWRDLSRAMADFKGKTGLLGVVDSSNNDPMLVRILGRAEPTPDALDFLTRGVNCVRVLIEDRRNTDFPLDIQSGTRGSGIYVDRKEMSLKASLIAPWKQFMPLKNDTYNPGFMTEFGQKSTMLRPAMLRLICANGMTVMTRICSKRISARDPRAYLNSVKKVDPFGQVGKFLKEGVRRMVGTSASVYEAVQVGGIINDPEGGKYIIDLNRMQEIYKDPGLFDQTSQYLKYANSGINSYDLFNIMTDHASHDKSLDDGQRNQLNVMASRMLVDGPNRSVMPPDPFMRRK